MTADGAAGTGTTALAQGSGDKAFRARLSAALFRHQSGGGPEIAETSVVTVDMPWLPASVRLLEPLEKSRIPNKYSWRFPTGR